MCTRPDAALDPELVTVVERLHRDGWLPLTPGASGEHADRAGTAVPPDVASARQRYRDLAAARGGADDLPVAEVHDDVAIGIAGTDADVEVRVYTPERRRNATVVWLHGGGWVLGDLDTADLAARRVARALGATVVSVHYRRAPEHPHPAPLQDAYAALRWAAARRPGDRLAVAGDSAGGGLAAGVALLARDWGPTLDAQLLFYPGLDPTMGRPSVGENAGGPFLTRTDMEWFWARYVPDTSSHADPTVALLEAAGAPDGLAGLAPAVVATAAHDPLRDEGRAYADALEAAGVPVRRRTGDRLAHGYVGFAAVVPAARAEVEAALDDLGSLLGGPGLSGDGFD